MEQESSDEECDNQIYQRLRRCVSEDFNWLEKIKAAANTETEILLAIRNLTEENLKDPITKKAAEVLRDKECRDVFIKHGLLNLLRILSYSKIPEAYDLQPSLNYFNLKAGCTYKSHSSMYAALMPRNYKIGEFAVYTTSQEELALNYKLFKNKSLQKKKGRKRKASHSQDDILTEMRLAKRNESNSRYGCQSESMETSRSDDEGSSIFTETAYNGVTLENYVLQIGKMVKAQIDEANAGFTEQAARIQNQIETLKTQLQTKQQELVDLEQFRACFLEEIKKNVVEKVEKSFE